MARIIIFTWLGLSRDGADYSGYALKLFEGINKSFFTLFVERKCIPLYLAKIVTYNQINNL